MTVYEKLLEKAKKARDGAYAPYTNYSVGAALLCDDGRIYTGCNIENAALTPSICAERAAFFKAVSEGERRFVMIAIVGGKVGQNEGFAPPCGVCRQVMTEFCRDNFEIVLLKDGRPYVTTLNAALPDRFTAKNFDM